MRSSAANVNSSTSIGIATTATATATATETPTAASAAAGAGVAASASSISTLIKDQDVLCGRGNGIPKSHKGNKNYRRLIHANKDLYKICHKKDKKKISRGIVEAIHKAGGRFIDYDQDSNIIIDIEYKQAVDKTSQAIRDTKKPQPQAIREPKKTKSVNIDTSNVDWGRELPQEWYTDWSLQVLMPIDSSNAVTAGDAPQNERTALAQNHQEVPACTSASATSSGSNVKSNPFYQEHVSRPRDVHQYARQTSGSSVFSLGSFLDGCFDENALPLDNHHAPPAKRGEVRLYPIDIDGVCNELIRDGKSMDEC